ncbi:ABC transporter substrate-binding protein [Bradyrhizobium sp. NP1]|uniref:ABC transporter substrate-binding protein n=1 Tax=Bradyrhizobium sp. NP1 TaxID=3049772 RepID=UPI0025A5B406|nr:ABC transporter substrate-binding protein [Bradyrhizobium sp. NP1]WJR79217.1 ABC transporter substrate-binding protein [Bradyrhizobium sp. NP1]
MTVTRRRLLATATLGVASSVFKGVRLARAADDVLRVVIHSPLRIIDPIVTIARNTQMHGYMVYDTLFSLDSKRVPRPQMVDTYTVTEDGKTFVFKLRPSLRFHDGAPVTSRDVIASLQRWGKKDGLGRMLMEASELTAIEDDRFQLKLTKPFGMVLEALGKPGTYAPFIMPARIASASPDVAIKDATGSGPYIFKQDEWVPGSKSVYVRNPHWVSRSEPPDFLSGAKIPKIQRVEWVSFPDPNVALSALQTGEIDYFEYPPLDLVGIVQERRDLKLVKVDPWGAQGWIRPNSLHPPFNNPKARQALLHLVDQNQYMQTLGVPRDMYYQHCGAIFLCGTPLETDVGASDYLTPNAKLARSLLEEAGYNGEKLVVLHPTDIPDMDAATTVTAQSLRKIGVNVDLQAMAWGTLLGRRLKREAPAQGGWNLYHTLDFSFNIDTPMANSFLVSSCDDAGPGWPCDAEIETLRFAWAKEPDAAKRLDVAKQIQRRFYQTVPYVPWGQFSRPVATRASVQNIGATFIPVFWNLTKT